MGEMDASEEGTTSLSKTSRENVDAAALLEARFVSIGGPDSEVDIATEHLKGSVQLSVLSYRLISRWSMIDDHY